MHSHLEKPLLVTLIYNTPGVGWVHHHLTQPFLFRGSEPLKNRPYSNVVVADCLSSVFYGKFVDLNMKHKTTVSMHGESKEQKQNTLFATHIVPRALDLLKIQVRPSIFILETMHKISILYFVTQYQQFTVEHAA